MILKWSKKTALNLTQLNVKIWGREYVKRDTFGKINTSDTRHCLVLFPSQTTDHLRLFQEEEYLAPLRGDESPWNKRAPMWFEASQQVCLTYTGQRSFIRMLLTRHHKSQASRCFARQHPNRVASSLVRPPPFTFIYLHPGSSIKRPSFCLLFTENSCWQAAQVANTRLCILGLHHLN